MNSGPNRPNAKSSNNADNAGEGDLTKLYDEALNLARRATQSDVENQHDVAMSLCTSPSALD
jgi:hypothetical protein